MSENTPPDEALDGSPNSSTSSETVDDDPGTLQERIIEAISTVFDPEIPVNIYALGLIYDVAVNDDQSIGVKMTLTSPHCPVAESLPGDVQRTVESVPGVLSAEVEVVWDPAWNPAMMSEAARLELGMF